MAFDLDELLSSGTGNYDFEWLLTFLKGMIKPLAATTVVLMAVILSYMQKLGLGGEMVYSIVRAFSSASVIGSLSLDIQQDNVPNTFLEENWWLVLLSLLVLQ
ncbi:hypothetical protein D5086_029305 [Populus alba]|uniref:Uncharacterized protein n=1 Tax=Populus alba TaxID=43335 RepID=A0ACC4AT97_POPAL